MLRDGEVLVRQEQSEWERGQDDEVQKGPEDQMMRSRKMMRSMGRGELLIYGHASCCNDLGFYWVCNGKSL